MELGFILFFVLHSIKLSQSHYPGQGFDELIWVDLVHFFLSISISSFNIGISYPKSQVNSCFFVLYFIYFFLNFIIQHLVVLELGFISFFFPFYKVILVPYVSHEFGRLTLDDSFFLIDMFFNFII